MSSSPRVRHEATPRRSTASSSTLASIERQDDLLAGSPEPSSARASQVTPNNTSNRRSRTMSRMHDSADPKRGSLGRSGGFLLASSVKFGSLGKRTPKHDASSQTPNSTSQKRSRQSKMQQDLDVDTINSEADGHHDVDREDGPSSRPGAAHSSEEFNGARSSGEGAYDDTNSGQIRSAQRWTEADGIAPVHQSAAIDPAQIVSMALNLSEGRRRHLTGNLSSTPVSRSSPRTASHASPNGQLTHDYGTGGSLKKHLQDQRRISKHLTTKAELNTSEQNHRHLPTSVAAAAENNSSPSYHLSVATLTRAEKARNYFELAAQYRRLLSNLPSLPLAHDENSLEVPSSSPKQLPQGHNEHIRTERAYNPLQTIRNRRTRARSRKILDPKSDLWTDRNAVHDWVNIVENVAHDSSYNWGTRTILPRYPPKQHEYLTTTTVDSDKDPGVEPRKLTRPKLDWAFSPAELLADTYWLEQDSNKSLIEDRNGSRLYPAFTAQELARYSVDSGPRELNTVLVEADKALDSEVDTEPYVQRGRTAQGENTYDSSGRLKHAWHKARRRSPSDSSEVSHSENDRLRATNKRRPQHPPDLLSTGPLERYLNNMMEQQGAASGSQVESSSMNKARDDTPDAQHGVQEHQNKMLIDGTAATAAQARSQADLKALKDERNTKRPAVPILHQSKGSLDFWSPSSPISRDFNSQRFDASKGDRSKESPAGHKSTKHIFPFGRTHAKHGKRAESGSTNADDSDKSSPRQSEDSKAIHPSIEVNDSSLRGQGLVLDTRHNDSVNSLVTSPSTYLNGRSKDPDSAVRRFFKGGMIGLRREGHRSRKAQKDIPEKDPGMTDDTDTDFVHDSDTEDTSSTRGGAKNEAQRRRPYQSTPRIGKSESANTKHQYHLDLPVFKPAKSPQVSRPTTPDRETEARRYARSPLRDASSTDLYDGSSKTFDNLGRVTTQSSTSQSEQRQRHLGQELSSPLNARAHSQDASKRLNTVLQDAGSPLRQSRSPTSPVQEHEEHLGSTPSSQQLQGRHWSITDSNARRASMVMNPKTLSRVTQADIARVRTLLICTGIKAAALARRAHGNAPVDAFKSAETQGVVVRALSDRTAMIAASRKFTSDITRESFALHNSATTFRNQTVLPLHRSLHEMRVAVTESAEQARTAGDEAVGFGALVTGQKTIEVRRVIDQMEKFRRRRRRRVRWIRRVAFGLLEWGVLLVMWQVWFVVMIFKTVWSVVRGVVGVGRWALWL